MRSLSLPQRNSDEEDLKTSVTTYNYRGEIRGHDISDDEISAVLGIYDTYDGNGGQFSDPLKAEGLAAALTSTIKKAFTKTYEGGCLEALRQRLLLGADHCPICGIDPADELDHFLPKSDFQVLAIYARNLIPICNRCNKDKRTKWGKSPETQFVHPYLESIPDADFIGASTELLGSRLSITLGILDGAAISDELAARIEYQFAVLNLNKRYAREINIYVGGKSLSLHELYAEQDASAVSEWLTRQAKYEADRFHRNDWRAAVFRSLALHEEFCDGGFGTAYPLP